MNRFRPPASLQPCAAKWPFPRAFLEAPARASRLLLLLVLAAWAAAAPAEVPAMAGFYGGGFGAPGAFSYTQIELDEGPTLAGRIYQPYERTDTPPITGLQRQGQNLRFEAAGLNFDLNRTATGFEGTVQPAGGVPQPAYFAIRPGTPPAERVARYEATYDLGEGRLLTLARNADSGSLWYLEAPSGRTGFLFNLSDTEFIAGPCIIAPVPNIFAFVCCPGRRPTPSLRSA